MDERIAGLAGLPIAELRMVWSDSWGTPPPKGARRRLLMLGIAWKCQADTLGGMSRQLERRLAALEASFGQGGTVDARAAKQASAPRLLPGTRLMRAWGDERHEVIVTETGFLWRGKCWTSLSAIARAITGSRRNGPAFFGLRDGDAA
ncbi:MAG TPA: DUF2924 domain-containing protein [Amaricoccus sp.]|uniref:DUF2924 domain-containing protein n=1 Tax=Amaricoccus sp. TaxID=1872485 RepID=UPI002CA7B57D|nr:DUF2924 domain-containing protein [Amaricoccus sp.]HMR54780.1 DUF2924 domain-containing protein [Amaricoccus sp.]HMU01795.1 DUF2924 domain-containing protein [Amaricoccus sp.]